jgi:uncharacterized protein with HEPN domain
MLDAAKEALSHAKGRTRKDLDADRQLTHSLVRPIEIIGEAAANVTKEFKEINSQIPWRNIITMRNRLIHVYFDINLDRVWDTVTDDLPPLVAELERIIASKESHSP